MDRSRGKSNCILLSQGGTLDWKSWSNFRTFLSFPSSFDKHLEIFGIHRSCSVEDTVWLVIEMIIRNQIITRACTVRREFVEKSFCDFFEASKDAAELELVYVTYRKAISVNAEVAKARFQRC
jgi:hypothetical protein